MWILDNTSGVFSSEYAQGCPSAGIGGYHLLSPADRAFAFDCGSSGRQDHIVLFRPGTGTIWILQNNGGDFSPVYHTGDPGSGVGGYFIESPDDRAFAFDFNGSGMANHFGFWRIFKWFSGSCSLRGTPVSREILGVGFEVMICFRLLIEHSELSTREAGDQTAWFCIGQVPGRFAFCNVIQQIITPNG